MMTYRVTNNKDPLYIQKSIRTYHLVIVNLSSRCCIIMLNSMTLSGKKENTPKNKNCLPISEIELFTKVICLGLGQNPLLWGHRMMDKQTAPTTFVHQTGAKC